MAPGIIEIYPTIFAATTKVDKLIKSNLMPIKYPITTKALITPNHSAIEIKNNFIWFFLENLIFPKKTKPIQKEYTNLHQQAKAYNFVNLDLSETLKKLRK